MLKLALKNLWNRRGRYGWLFAELVIAALLSWFAIDRLVVSAAYMSSVDYGYDHDRLLLVELADADFDGRTIDPERDDFDSRSTDFATIMEAAAAVSGVEAVTRIPSPYLECMQGGSAIELNDTTFCFTSKLNYIPSTRYFSTYGIARADVAGNPSLEELDNMALAPGEAIVTRRVAEMLYGDAAASFAASAQAAAEWTGNEYARPEIIRGIVENVMPRTDCTSRCVIFRPVISPGGRFLLVRTAPGVKAADLVDPLNELGMAGALSRGTYRYRKTVTYQTLTERVVGDQNFEFFLRLFAFFFLANLFLGVLGTFWLMTRKRSEEMGIVRSFGSTSADVRRLLMTEGAVLTLVSWLIGTAIFFYLMHSFDPSFGSFIYALPDGMSEAIWVSRSSELDTSFIDRYSGSWVTDFWSHFAVSSAVTLSVLMAVVLLGIAIPARKLSRVNPVDALRSE